MERKIGATADAHLASGTASLIPWKVIGALFVLTGAFIAFSKNHYFLLLLATLAIGQQIAFSMVSRSRNRENMAYHVIASIFSNGVWFLTFRQIQVKHWTLGNLCTVLGGTSCP